MEIKDTSNVAVKYQDRKLFCSKKDKLETVLYHLLGEVKDKSYTITITDINEEKE